MYIFASLPNTDSGLLEVLFFTGKVSESHNYDWL